MQPSNDVSGYQAIYGWLTWICILRSPEEGRAGPSGFQGSAQGMEGIDESSQNDLLVPRAARTPSTAPRVGPFPAELFCTASPSRVSPLLRGCRYKILSLASMHSMLLIVHHNISREDVIEARILNRIILHADKAAHSEHAAGRGDSILHQQRDAPMSARDGCGCRRRSAACQRRAGRLGGRARPLGQRLTLSSQRNSHWGRSTPTLEEPPAAEKPLEGKLWPVGSHGHHLYCFQMQDVAVQSHQTDTAASCCRVQLTCERGVCEACALCGGREPPRNAAVCAALARSCAPTPLATRLWALTRPRGCCRSRPCCQHHHGPHQEPPQGTSWYTCWSTSDLALCRLQRRGRKRSHSSCLSLKCCYIATARSVSHGHEDAQL